MLLRLALNGQLQGLRLIPQKTSGRTKATYLFDSSKHHRRSFNRSYIRFPVRFAQQVDFCDFQKAIDACAQPLQETPIGTPSQECEASKGVKSRVFAEDP